MQEVLFSALIWSNPFQSFKNDNFHIEKTTSWRCIIGGITLWKLVSKSRSSGIITKSNSATDFLTPQSHRNELERSKLNTVGDETERYSTEFVCKQLQVKQPQYNKIHDTVILKHGNVRTHVAKIVIDIHRNLEIKSSVQSAVLSRRCFLWLSVVSMNNTRLGWLVLPILNRHWIDSWIASKDDQFLQ